jgi:hypothetical protein
MSATDLDIRGPRELFNENRDVVTGNDFEKASAPDLKKSFHAAVYGSTPLDARVAQNKGLQQALNPQEPIIAPEQKQIMAIDPRELGMRAQITGMSLQETKMGQQNDSIFSAGISTLSESMRGISQAINPQQPQITMDPRLMHLQMQQQFMMRPGGML